ncbi:MAG TPA: AMP-dependent synthetase/ligase [Polyangiaceae bacterium]|jgi:long-chain acyl-CoA synthetase|nr:AMP-dependent synthetase/ligase [Polyangiaceae bacterium]
MDVTKYLDLNIAPRVLFDVLPERKDKPRFFVRAKDQSWTPITWQAFADQVARVALYLAASSFRPGDRAAVYAPNSVEWAAAALAIQAAGGTMVPIYAASTLEQVAYVAGHCDAKIIFTIGALLPRVKDAWSKLPALERVILVDETKSEDARVVEWEKARAEGDVTKLIDAVDLDATGLMLYTSGTTGNPKGVPLSHRNIACNGRDWLQCNAPLLDEGAVDVLWLPMSHIFGFGEMCLGNTLGWVSYMSDPREVLSLLPDLKPQVFMSVPSHWEKLAHDPSKIREATGGRLKFCLSGGAGLKREVKEAFHQAGVLIIEGYGLTETSPTLTLNRPDAFRFDSVGKPLPSVELKLAEDGEILAKGPNVFGGYHKDEAATREIFTEDGWLKTGDVGRWTEDGFLQIIDRKKDILVTAGGKNVPPANIEQRFAGDPLLSHAVVYGDGKRYLVCGVWVNDTTMDEASLRAAVQQRVDAVNKDLASYETIKKFAILREPLTVEAGLLTASLKVRRKKVYEKYKTVFESLYE